MRSEPPKYNLHVDLQYPVDEERGSAKFDKSKKTLVVTLPIKPGPQLIAERLGSNDSGIEVDTAYRTKQCSDEMITEVNDKVTNHDGDDHDKILDPVEENRTESNDSVQDDFLDANISYMYPSFTCSVQNHVITLTLEVKNVSPDSFVKKLFSDPQAVAFKFSSIGSGYVPFHHAFAIQFLAPGSFDEDQFEIDFWDNNIVIQFPFSVNMETGYKVGPSLSNIVDVLHKLESYDMDTTELNIQVGSS